jgi:carbon storage regulator
MLVLSRKLGQEIVIGDNVRVRVVAIHGAQVRLGFTAPAEVSICREELMGAASPRSAREIAGVSDETPLPV